MEYIEKPVANPTVVLREEFDDWGILFAPDTGEAYGINPVAAFIWKCLDGAHTQADIVRKLRELCDDVPAVLEDHVRTFIQSLVSKGLAGMQVSPES